MKICPNCLAEFLDHILICPDCQKVLVNELEHDHGKKKVFLSSDENMVVFIEGALSNCREMEGVLQKANISCAIYPLSMKTEEGAAALGTTNTMKYAVFIAEQDLEKAKNVLQGRFYEDVLREGQGLLMEDAINMEDTIIKCPACGESGALVEGECIHCGLFLGM